MTEAAIWKMTHSHFIVFLPAIFGDRVTRIRGLVLFSFITTMLFVLYSAGQNGITPSRGSRTGFIGLILETHLLSIIPAILLTPIAFAILYLPERVLGDLWRMVCSLPPSEEPREQSWAAAFGQRFEKHLNQPQKNT